MKYIFLISVLFSSLTGTAKDLQELRNLFYKASFEELCPEEFLNRIDEYTEAPSNTKQAYQAMAYMLLSKEAWNPYHKFDYFQKGKNLLEEAIKNEPNNPELRYLRLCIQYNLPKILNYSQHIREDQNFIVRNWKLIEDADLKKKIKGYFVQNNILSSNQLNSNLN